jgi:hypothetical protein
MSDRRAWSPPRGDLEAPLWAVRDPLDDSDATSDAGVRRLAGEDSEQKKAGGPGLAGRVPSRLSSPRGLRQHVPTLELGSECLTNDPKIVVEGERFPIRY